MNTDRYVTMDDVAAAAGVSRQTISRVVHGHAYVSEPTRVRVQEAIQVLGYMPDPIARSLVRKRTFLLAVVITDFTGSTRAQVLMGAELEAREHGYNIFITGAQAGELGEPLGSPLLNLQRYEGLLILYCGSLRDRYELFESIRPGLPVVTIGYGTAKHKVLRLVSDNERAAGEAVGHLLACAHRLIAQVAGPSGRLDAEERSRGYENALGRAGIRVDPRLTCHGDWTAESGYASTRELLEEGAGFTAVFVHSDLMALGCMKALKERGLHIPQDVAVVGFDDIDISAYTDPPLTTVHNPYREMGRLGIRYLIERITGKRKRGGTVVLPARLIVRGSSCVGRPSTD